MPKTTSTERVRAFRQRAKKYPKSTSQRLKKFRPRSKALKDGVKSSQPDVQTSTIDNMDDISNTSAILKKSKVLFQTPMCSTNTSFLIPMCFICLKTKSNLSKVSQAILTKLLLCTEKTDEFIKHISNETKICTNCSRKLHGSFLTQYTDPNFKEMCLKNVVQFKTYIDKLKSVPNDNKGFKFMKTELTDLGFKRELNEDDFDDSMNFGQQAIEPFKYKTIKEEMFEETCKGMNCEPSKSTECSENLDLQSIHSGRDQVLSLSNIKVNCKPSKSTEYSENSDLQFLHSGRNQVLPMNNSKVNCEPSKSTECSKNPDLQSLHFGRDQVLSLSNIKVNCEPSKNTEYSEKPDLQSLHSRRDHILPMSKVNCEPSKSIECSENPDLQSLHSGRDQVLPMSYSKVNCDPSKSTECSKNPDLQLPHSGRNQILPPSNSKVNYEPSKTTECSKNPDLQSPHSGRDQILPPSNSKVNCEPSKSTECLENVLPSSNSTNTQFNVKLYSSVHKEEILVEMSSEKSSNFKVSNNKQEVPLQYYNIKIEFSLPKKDITHVSEQQQPKPPLSYTSESVCCRMCSKLCKDKKDFDLHLMVHINLLNGLYSCQICKKSFKTQEAVMKHMLTHSINRSFSCSMCSKAFLSKTALSKHSLIHKIQSACVCSVCGKNYLSKSGLSNHMIIHNRQGSLECSKCGLRFWRKVNLKMHMKRHKQCSTQS